LPKIGGGPSRIIIKTSYLAFLLIPLFFAFLITRPAVYAVNSGHFDVPLNPPQISSVQPGEPYPSTTTVRTYVLAQAKLLGVNPAKVEWIVGHESQYGQNMRGDDGQSRGYWMISSVWHPEVSDACADDLECSTAWSLHRILEGHINEWSTWKFCRAWYPDCPF
jgi:hypothetical protein